MFRPSLTILFALLLPLLLCRAQERPAFVPETIDATLGGRTAIADLDGDGLNDVALHVWGSQRGKVADGSIRWYRYPDWKPTVVVEDRKIFGDMIVPHDFDGDGDQDLIAALGDDGRADLWWYENNGDGSQWTEHHLGLSGLKSEIKDLEVVDMDGDGREDIVSRLKKEIVIWYHEENGAVTKASQSIAGREGMGVGDVDGDGDPDVVLNGFWLENTGERVGAWPRYDIDPRFFQAGTQPAEAARWRDFSVRVQFADIDGDGSDNLILCHAEHRGFPVIWYGTDDPRGGPEAWEAHEVGVVDYAHTLKAADLDQDGRIDLLAAGTRHDPESRVVVFYNLGEGRFERTAWAESAPTYAASLGDIDNDGDLDLVSAYSWEDAPLKVWRNALIDHRAVAGWKRHLIDPALPYQAIFVDAGDLNGDGQPDLIAGGAWYEAVNRLQYERHEIGGDFGNFYLQGDFDEDGDIDLFGLNGRPWGSIPKWAENDGNGNFTVHSNLTQAEGDFLQGMVTLRDAAGRRLLVLSWHGKSQKTEAYVIPEDPVNEPWELVELAPFTLNEALAAADMDADGDDDLVMGNRWLEQTESGWTPRAFGQSDPATFEPQYTPDRNAVEDFNADGRPDVAVGLEKGIDILVYENPLPTNPWRWNKEVIGHVPGQGFSLDSGDFDGDGDPDIVVGEHRGPKGVNNVYLFENRNDARSWKRHLIDRGAGTAIDHHDGTVAHDLDGDGDLDIVTIGWYHPKIWILENLGNAGLSAPNEVDGVNISLHSKEPENPLGLVEVEIEKSWLQGMRTEAADSFDADDFVLREVDAQGRVRSPDVPFQFFGSTPAQELASNLTGLAFLPAARSELDRQFLLVPGEREAPEPRVEVEYPAFFHGVSSIRVTNDAGTAWYDEAGAGFSRLLDNDGRDWIGYSPGKGAAGEYRGIPNMGYPEGYMHPGKKRSRSQLLRHGPLLASIYSESLDGAWAGQWDISPGALRLTVLRASHPFWFLYEGTPGGAVEKDADRWIRADGTSGTLAEAWAEVTPAHATQWVAFSDAERDRSLLLLNCHYPTTKNSYRLMEDAMTVFGFGRVGMEKAFTSTPAGFRVVLVESREADDLRAVAARHLHPPRVEVSAVRRSKLDGAEAEE